MIQQFDEFLTLPEQWALTPVKGKKPYRRGWQSELPLDRQFILSEIKNDKASGFGLRLGEISNGLLAIDFDGESAKTKWDKIRGDNPDIETVSWSSGKLGRKQILLQIPDKYRDKLKDFTKRHINTDEHQQLEFRYNSMQSVLPPSIHPDLGQPYYWINSPDKVAVAIAPEWLLNFLCELTNPKLKEEREMQESVNQVELALECLKYIDPDCNYDEWLHVGMALHTIDSNLINEYDRWSSQGSKYKSSTEIEQKWNSFTRNEVKIGTLVEYAKHSGFNASQWCKEWHKQHSSSKPKPKPQKENTEPKKKKPVGVQAWEYLEKNYGASLSFNELKMVIELDGERLDEDVVSSFYVDLELDEYITISKERAATVFEKYAKQRSYHPVKKYIQQSHDKYGQAGFDIKRLASRYFGLEDDLYNEMLYRHLIASVARVFKPGCKKDEAVVLHGATGIGKSTFFRVLYGDEFFTDDVKRLDKDDCLKVNTYWCIELAELDHITSRKEAGELKAFFSRQTDVFRKPYGRVTSEYKRRSVLVGSVNKSEFLIDETGNRRYHIIPVAQVDLELLRGDRDLIWAAAYQAYLDGEQWYLTNHFETLARAEANEYMVSDVWEEPILNHIDGMESVDISSILTFIGVELDKQDRRSQMRVSKILTQNGWKRAKQTMINGKRTRLWIPTQSTQPTQPTQPFFEVEQRLSTSENYTQQCITQPTQPTQPFFENYPVNGNSVGNTSHDILSIHKNNNKGIKVVEKVEEVEQDGENHYPVVNSEVLNLENEVEQVEQKVEQGSENHYPVVNSAVLNLENEVEQVEPKVEQGSENLNPVVNSEVLNLENEVEQVEQKVSEVEQEAEFLADYVEQATDEIVIEALLRHSGGNEKKIADLVSAVWRELENRGTMTGDILNRLCDVGSKASERIKQ